MPRLLYLLLGLLLASLLGSCGARTFSEYELGNLQINVASALESELEVGELELLQTELADGSLEVRVLNRSLTPRRTALLELRFPEELAPSEIAAPAASGAQLALLVTDKPGLLAFGLIEDSGGYVPSGEMLRFRLQTGTLARRATLAPGVAGGTVGDLTAVVGDALPGELSWSYVNQGDYNQDGLVNVADLAQIGIHFQKTGPWDYSAVESVVDGTPDGVISVADLTPIGLNYLRKVTGYRVYRSATETINPQQLDLYAEVDLANAVGGLTTRKNFRADLNSDVVSAADWLCVAPIDSTDGTEGPYSNVVQASSTADTEPPVWTTTTGVTNVLPGNSQVTVTWGVATDLQSPPVSYTVYHNEGTSVDFEAQGQVVAAPLQQLVISGLTNGIEYAFAVRASDSAPVPNQEQNAVTLTAIPAQGKAFGLPPAGTQTAEPQGGQTPQLVIVPSTTQSADAGAPVIFSLRTEAEPPGNHLYCTRFSEGSWESLSILSASSYSGLQAFALVDGSQQLTFHVVTYDLTSGKLLHLRFDEALALSGSEDVSLNLNLAQVPVQISADYDADSESFGVLAGYSDATTGVLRYSQKVGDGNYVSFADVYDGDPVFSLCFEFDPSGAQPWLAFNHGTIDTTTTIDFMLTGETGRFDGAAWNLTEIDYTDDPVQLELSFGVDGTPLLAFSAVRPATVVTVDIDVLFDMVVADYNGAAWNYGLAYQSSADIQPGLPNTSVTLGVAPAVSWAGQEELLISELAGSFVVDSFTQEVVSGALDVLPHYRTQALSDYTQDSGYFDGDPGLNFDWAQSSQGPAAAYLGAASLDAADILAGNLGVNGALLYWSTD